MADAHNRQQTPVVLPILTTNHITIHLYNFLQSVIVLKDRNNLQHIHPHKVHQGCHKFGDTMDHIVDMSSHLDMLMLEKDKYMLVCILLSSRTYKIFHREFLVGFRETLDISSFGHTKHTLHVKHFHSIGIGNGERGHAPPPII